MDSEASILGTIATLAARLPTGSAIVDVHRQVSSAMHERLRSSQVSEDLVPYAVAPYPVLRFNYDEGHSGRLTVFGSGGGTVALGDVLTRPSPFQFIRDHLAFGEDGTSGETVIFCPGLNTPHERREDYAQSFTAPERAAFYSKILGGLRLAQLHTGSSKDQGPVEVQVENAPFLNLLFSVVEGVGVELGEPNDKGEIEMDAGMIDFIQSAATLLDVNESRMKTSMMELISRASPSSPLVLMVYSRGSVECASALRKFISDQEEVGVSSDELQTNLRNSLTVVTIGNVSENFPDGPAYIHVSSQFDPLTSTHGVSALKPSGAGEGAVFLTFGKQVYKDSDNHNMASVLGQYISVIMLANKTNSFRRLYNLANGEVSSRGIPQEVASRGMGDRVKGSSAYGHFMSAVKALWAKVEAAMPGEAASVGGGNLVVPDNVNELTMAMIRITCGLDYRWDSDEDATLEQPPSMNQALVLLKDHLDPRSIDSIHLACKEKFFEESPYAEPGDN